MKKIFIILIITFIGTAAISQHDNADAVYLKLVKEYTLNTDGSYDYSCEKELKLLTHFSFHRLYGETFIIYNPDFQELDINHAYTIMADGKKIVTPENAFNKVLPRFASHAPAYNMLREMVVTHTGLEVGAVIHLKYTLHTAKDFMPVFMGTETIGESSPIEEQIIRIRIPKDIELKHKTYNYRTAPEITTEGNFTVYTWIFKDVPLIPHESHRDRSQQAEIVFSAAKDLHRVYDRFVNQEAFRMMPDMKIKDLVKELTSEAKNNLEKTLALQKHVVNNMATYNIPLKHTAFKVRTPAEVMASNGGTPLEKTLLLSTLIKDAGINAIPVMSFPENYYNRALGNLLTENGFYIQVNPRDGKQFYISAVSPASHNLAYDLGGNILLQLDAAIESLRTFSPEIKAGEIEFGSGLVIEDLEKFSGTAFLELKNNVNPYFKLTQDSNFAKTLMTAYAGKANISRYIPDRLDEAKSEISYEIEGKDPFTEKEGYYFMNLPQVKNSIYYQHLEKLPTERLTTLKLDHPVKETYEYTLVLPEKYEFLNPEKEIKMENTAGNLMINFRKKGNELIIKREIHIPDEKIPVTLYHDFRDLMLTWFDQKYRKVIVKEK